MENIKVRKGRIEDLPAVLDLVKELAAYTGYLDQVENTVEQMEIDGFGPEPIYGLLVAEKDNAILGTSIYYYRFSTWKGKRLYLEDFVVRESERGKGIGKLLFEATMKIALEEKCSGMLWQVLKDNKNAIGFYESYKADFNREFINCGLEADQMKGIII
jgi:GNAT superfamily N-acetyltransferase